MLTSIIESQITTSVSPPAVLVVSRFREIHVYVFPAGFIPRYLKILPRLGNHAYGCSVDADWNFIITQYSYSHDGQIIMTPKQKFPIGSDEAEFIGNIFLNDTWDAYIQPIDVSVRGPIGSVYFISDLLYNR